jgi:hypothetical protein
MSTIRVYSTKDIEVIKELAYDDRSPEMAKAGQVIGDGNFIRVMTLSPVSYEFKKGANDVPDPFTFIDPVTKKEVKESITEWPAVKALVKTGILEIYKSGDKVNTNAPAKSTKKKTLDDISQEASN